MVLFACLLLARCDGGNHDGGSGLKTALEFTPPAAGVSDVIWIAEGARSGNILVVEVVARDLSASFDGFDLEFTFDPLIVRAEGVSSGGVLADCSALPVLKIDNVANGNANLSGTILISESTTESPPPACVLTGTRPLARVTFRGMGRGLSPLALVPYNGDPNAPAGTRLYRKEPPVPSLPVGLFDSDADIHVTR